MCHKCKRDRKAIPKYSHNWKPVKIRKIKGTWSPPTCTSPAASRTQSVRFLDRRTVTTLRMKLEFIYPCLSQSTLDFWHENFSYIVMLPFLFQYLRSCLTRVIEQKIDELNVQAAPCAPPTPNYNNLNPKVFESEWLGTWKIPYLWCSAEVGSDLKTPELSEAMKQRGIYLTNKLR